MATLTRKLGTALSLVKFWHDAALNGERTPEYLTEFVMRYRGVAPVQIRSELLEFALLVHQRCPETILEIGTRTGGTLFILCRLASKAARVISVDLPGGRFGGGYEFFRIPILRRMKLPGQHLELIRADSHRLETREDVVDVLEHRKIDFLFIDGDHTYDGVKQDFQMYSPLVRQGGIIVFHDIVKPIASSHGGETDCGVDRFWNEIKSKYRHAEIIEDAQQGWGGIGILHV